MTTYYRNKNSYSCDADKDYELWMLLSDARYAVFRAREKELYRYRLSPEHARVLFTVQALQNRATPAEISRSLLLKPHSVSSMLTRMEKLGLIEKKPHSERKNMVLIVLTQKGMNAYRYSTVRGPIHRILNNIQEKDRKQLKKTLEIILKEARKELSYYPDKWTW